MTKGISIKPYIGIGDTVQFSSLPENYFRNTGKRLVDVSRAWIFDHNPFVVRTLRPPHVTELWNWPKQFEWPVTKTGVYRSNAEIWAGVMGVPVILNRPRLYVFESFPYEKREKILFHTEGKSHGKLPEHVIDHVIKKYRPTKRLFHVEQKGKLYPDYGIPRIQTETVWDLARVISECQVFIGVDSGPSWIAACYPDVVIKKIRNRTVHGAVPWEDWVPLEADNFHSHWDDRIFQIFHPGEDDLGFMASYRKI